MVINLDLKLLSVITELDRTRSVSQTAENLELSQSAVSMSLAKLRKHFKDPLFVRTSGGMAPTPHATELIRLLKNAEGMLQAALDLHAEFDPATSDQRFTLHCSDLAQVAMIPELMHRLSELAPHVQVDVRRSSGATIELLESETASLAIGFPLPVGAGFCQQHLFTEKFVCAVRQDHPRILGTLNVEDLARESHVGVTAAASDQAMVEKALRENHIHRHIGLTVPSFLGIGSILATVDSVAILPERLANQVKITGQVKVFALPFSIPVQYVVQQWHERYTHDPASRWLRSLIAQLFLRRDRTLESVA